MKKTIFAISLTLLTACAAYKSIAPTQADADRGAAQFPGLTIADLNNGKQILETKCTKCHAASKPFNASAEEFQKVLPNMAKKAGIDASQEELVRKYVITMKPAMQKK